MTVPVYSAVRRVVADRAWYETVKRHKSRLGYRAAPAYTRYLGRCQRDYRMDRPVMPKIEAAAHQFNEQGVASLWTPGTGELATKLMARLDDEQRKDEGVWNANGRYMAGEAYLRFSEMEGFLAGDLGDLYRAIFRAEFKIYYSLIYRSIRTAEKPADSQVWHGDGGPGTCINTLIYLTDVGPAHGALDCLPWRESLDIFQGERRALRERAKAGIEEERRQAVANYYSEQVESRFADQVVQPIGKAGLVVVFRNNLIHRGGFPDPGVTRYAALFHCYPSHRPTPFEKYRVDGTPKRGPFPADPTEDF